MKTYELVLNKQQAIVISKALELLSRIHMGQFSEIRNLFIKSINMQEALEIEKIIKEKIYPNLGGTGHYGITSKEINEDARVAWDIQQEIRYKISWNENPNENPNGGFGVNFDEPLWTSKSEHRPKLKINND
jgi:hypothetical protein